MALVDNCTHYWKLDGNSTDELGGSGTDTAVTYSAANGIIVQGAGLDAGTSSHVNTGVDLGYVATQSFSWNFWIKPSNYTSGAPLGQLGSFNAGDFFVNIYKDAYTSQRFTFEIDKQGTAGYVATSSTNYTSGSWYMVTATFNSSTNAMELFQNTSSVATATYSGGTSVTAKAGFYIGSIGSSNWITGAIDEVGIWSRVLSGSEITSLYNSGAGFQYPFSSGGGTTPLSNLTLLGVG